VFSQPATGVCNWAQVASVTPAGSPNRLRVTVTTAGAMGASDQTGIRLRVEGWRTADLKQGTPAAKTVTLQFGVRAPAGTYGIAFSNNGNSRCYVTEFTIAAGEANTDVVKSVVVPLCTDGFWSTNQFLGMGILWNLVAGSSTWTASPGTWLTSFFWSTANQFNFMGTNGNVFELFDVGLYEGTSPPPFQMPDYVNELEEAKRSFQKFNVMVDTSTAYHTLVMPVEMRANPTISGGGTGFTTAVAGTASMNLYQTTRAQQTLTFISRL
jgi:hypothetical protein